MSARVENTVSRQRVDSVALTMVGLGENQQANAAVAALRQQWCREPSVHGGNRAIMWALGITSYCIWIKRRMTVGEYCVNKENPNDREYKMHIYCCPFLPDPSNTGDLGKCHNKFAAKQKAELLGYKPAGFCDWCL